MLFLWTVEKNPLSHAEHRFKRFGLCLDVGFPVYRKKPHPGFPSFKRFGLCLDPA